MLRRSNIARFLSIISMLLALVAVSPALPVNAGGEPDYGPNANGYYWWLGTTGDGYGIFSDSKCDTPTPDSYHFKIRFYVDAGYKGARVTSCTYEELACAVPLYDYPTNADCNIIFGEGAADKISSFVVVGIDPGYDVCLYDGNFYSGSYTRVYSSNDDRSSLTTMNDAIQSWRKRAEGTPC